MAEKKSKEMKSAEEVVKEVEKSNEGLSTKPQDSGVEINQEILDSYMKLAEGLGFSLEEMLSTMLRVAEVLGNNPDLADYVTIEMKNQDGVLTQEEIDAFDARMQASISGDSPEDQTMKPQANDEEIIKAIAEIVPNANIENVTAFLKENGNSFTDKESFINGLTSFLAKSQAEGLGDMNEAKEEVVKDIDKNKDIGKTVAKVTVIEEEKAKDKKNKKDEAPYGAKEFMDYLKKKHNL